MEEGVHTNNDDDHSVGTAHSSVTASTKGEGNQAEDSVSGSVKKEKKRSSLNVTTLLFIQPDGSRREQVLPIRVQNYSELQREVARVVPGGREVVVMQDEKGNRLTSQNFIPRSKIVVRSLLLKPPNTSMLRTLRYDWEERDYHVARFQREEEEKAEKEAQQSISFL